MATVTGTKRHLGITSDTYDSNGDVVVGGNLTVEGTTTTLDTANLLVEDKNIIIGNVSTPSDITADGGGITLKGASDYTINWVNANDRWEFNQGIHSTGNITGANLSGTNTGDQDLSSYLTSYTETDTLASVTARGASTTTQLFFDGGFDSHPIMLSGAQNFDNIDRSGFYNLYNTNTSSTNSPGFDYGTMIAIGNDKGGSGFGLQIAHERTGTGMYVRGMNDTASAWSAWAEIWTSTTDGAGSGLDADKLDGQQGTHYLDYNNFSNTPTIPTDFVSAANGGTFADSINVHGNILLTGAATTTNQDRTIDFTGFDKEGTTDFSDRAYIRHTTNTGGHVGSVLVISSQNDSGDGIAFLTNSSSDLKHNNNVIWTSGNDGPTSGLAAQTAATATTATTATTAGSAAKLTDGGGLTTQPGQNNLIHTGQISAGTTGLFATSDNSNSVITLNRHSGNYDSQLGFSSNGYLYYRKFSNSTAFTTQVWKVLAFTDSDITGNAATVTTNANLTGHITSVGNATSLGSFTTAQLNAAISDGTVLTAEADTLDTVADRGSSTNQTIKSTNGLGFKVDSGGSARIEIENGGSNWAYLRLRDDSTVSWDIASYNGGNLEWRPAGSSTNRMTYSSAGLLSVPSITTTGNIHLDSDSAQLQLGDDNDMQIFHNGANGEIKTDTGDLIISSSGAIHLDYEGTNSSIELKNAGTTVGKISLASQDLRFISTVSDSDIIFRGNDNGTFFSAFLLDMSDSGKAYFYDDIQVSGGGIQLLGTGRIEGIDTVTDGTDAANKTYVDNAIAGTPQGTVTGTGVDNRIALWNGTSAIDSNENLSISGNDLVIGTQAGTTTSRLLLYGTTANNGASIIKTTNGNLHIDSDDGHTVYLNYYTGGSTSTIIGNGNTGPSGTFFQANGDVTVGSNLTISEYLYHAGDTDTNLRFQNNAITLTAGSRRAIDINTAETVVNEASADHNFRVESNNNVNMLFVDGGSDRVGIGIATPQERLTVDGGNIGLGLGAEVYGIIAPNNTTFGLDFIIGDGAVAADTPIMSLKSNDGSPGGGVQIYSSGSTVLDIQGSNGQLFSITDDLTGDLFTVSDISGVPIFNVNASGISYFDDKVGIGETSPSHKLDINQGELRIFNNQLDPKIILQGSDMSRRWVLSQDEEDNIGSTGFYIAEGTSVDANDALLYLTPSGNLGIGTTGPSSKLEVGGEIDAAGGDGYRIEGNPWANWTSNLLTLGDWDGEGYATRIMGSNSSEVMRVTGYNVGIGTTSPSTLLHTRKVGSSTTPNELRIESITYNGYGGESNINLYTSTYGNPGIYFGNQAAIASQPANIKYTGSSNLLNIETSGAFQISRSGVTKQVITSNKTYFISNNVGIHSTAPSTELEVGGTTTTENLAYTKPTADNQFRGEIVTFGSQSGIGQGDIVAYNSSGQWVKAQANSGTTSKNLLGVAMGTTAAAGILLRGFVRDSSFGNQTPSKGQHLYLSTSTSGDYQTAVPSTTGHIARIIGYSVDPTVEEIYFCPDNTFVEIA